jgi:hypothetical protein
MKTYITAHFHDSVNINAQTTKTSNRQYLELIIPRLFSLEELA